MYKSKKCIVTFLVTTSLLMVSGCSNNPSSKSNHSMAHGIKHGKLSVSAIPKSTHIHIHPFSTNQINFDSDTARTMAKSAPHLLATDIVYTLRNAGFTNVTLDETKGGAAEKSMSLVGSFTKLNPGSQNLRLWIGFGAGESEVCVEGKLKDTQGKVVGTLSHCENGIGWGGSKAQIEVEARTMGEKIGAFVSGIAK